MVLKMHKFTSFKVYFKKILKQEKKERKEKKTTVKKHFFQDTYVL